MIRSLDELDAEARAVLDACFTRVGSDIDPEFREEVLDDLRAYFADHLEPGATAADVTALAGTVGEAGEPDEPERGRFGGVPIDLSPPTAERVAHTWWNPRDERIFVPRVFGLGWAVNVGAVAVKLGLIEPDAEDEPFESTPATAFRGALLVPVALSAAVVAHYALRDLPARLPNQADIAGRACQLDQQARCGRHRHRGRRRPDRLGRLDHRSRRHGGEGSGIAGDGYRRRSGGRGADPVACRCTRRAGEAVVRPRPRCHAVGAGRRAAPRACPGWPERRATA